MSAHGALRADWRRLTATAAVGLQLVGGWPGLAQQATAAAIPAYDPCGSPGGVCDPGSMWHPSRAAPDISPAGAGDHGRLDAVKQPQGGARPV